MLMDSLRREGHSHQVRVRYFDVDGPWAHLKVLVSDSASAYVGSANLTGPAIGGANLELGVLVGGLAATEIERLLERYTETPTDLPTE